MLLCYIYTTLYRICMYMYIHIIHHTQMTKYSIVRVFTTNARNRPHLSRRSLAMLIHAATCAHGSNPHGDWCTLQFNIFKDGTMAKERQVCISV